MKYETKKEILNNLCDNCNPETDAVFAILANQRKGDYYAIGDMSLVAKGIKNILVNGIAGEEDSPTTIIAWTILGALREIQDRGVSIDELLTGFDDDDNEVEECADCDLMRVCNDKQAIEYRKSHGIPKPKHNKK